MKLREQPSSIQFQPLYTTFQPRLRSTYVDYVWGDGGSEYAVAVPAEGAATFCRLRTNFIRYRRIDRQQSQVVRALTCAC